MDAFLVYCGWRNVAGFLDMKTLCAVQSTCCDLYYCMQEMVEHRPIYINDMNADMLLARFPYNRSWIVSGHPSIRLFQRLEGKVHTLDASQKAGIHASLTDDDLAYLHGVHTLNLTHCAEITDAGLAHLRGVHTLNLFGCRKITDAGLAHLSGVHTLDIACCPLITNAGLAHLRGIYKLSIWADRLITDDGLAHLSGIHSLCLLGNQNFTEVGIAHLRGIRSLLIICRTERLRAALDTLTQEGCSVWKW